MTRLYAEVIGDPITHSKSPIIHQFWLEKLEIDADYDAHHVTVEGLSDYFEKRRRDPNWRGCNITLPHKLTAKAFVPNRSPIAELVGAINTVSRHWDGTLTATNTDFEGFAEPLADRHFTSAIVIGAGGAARSVLTALAERDGLTITIMNRDVEKAAALLREFDMVGQALPLTETPPIVDLLVNASSLGMIGYPKTPMVVDQVQPDGLVYDLVYAPLETELLHAAKKREIETIDGLTMLIGQAAAAFTRFFGADAPREYDEQLRELLIA
jgi:shikimate dehydrogenase